MNETDKEKLREAGLDEFNLSRLVRAFGHHDFILARGIEGWSAQVSTRGKRFIGEGFTPEEATIKLWLALPQDGKEIK